MRGCRESEDPEGPACRRLQNLIFRFVRFYGRQSGCLVRSTGPARAHLLLAPLEIVAQVLRQTLPPRLGLARMPCAFSPPRRMLIVVVALHGHPLPQNQGLRKRQAGQVRAKSGKTAKRLPGRSVPQKAAMEELARPGPCEPAIFPARPAQKLRNAACALPQAMAIGPSPDAACHEAPPDAAIAQG